MVSLIAKPMVMSAKEYEMGDKIETTEQMSTERRTDFLKTRAVSRSLRTITVAS